VHQQLATEILAEPLCDPKACESGKTTESRSTGKTKGNEDDHNGRLFYLLLRQGHVDQLPHQQRIDCGHSAGARGQYETKRDSL
jgi:hypothetical protein